MVKSTEEGKKKLIWKVVNTTNNKEAFFKLVELYASVAQSPSPYRLLR